MTSNIEKESVFVRFVLNGSGKQVKYLLRSLTVNQSKALCEIVFNFLHLALPDNVRKIISRHFSLFKKLSSKKISQAGKIRLIKSNSSLLYKCLLAAKSILEEVLK